MQNNTYKKSQRGRNIPAIKVYKHYWNGMKPFRWAFYFDVLLIVSVSIVSVNIPIFYKKFFDVLTKTADKMSASDQLVGILLVIFALNGLSWLLYRLGGFVHVYFQTRTLGKLRQNSFNYLIDHSYSFFTNNFTGSLVQRINRFARSFDRLSDRVIWNVIPIAVHIVGISIVLYYINPIITLVLVFWVLVFMGFNFFFSRWKLKYNIRSAEADSRTTAVLSDNVTNHNTIQLFTGADIEREGFKEVTDEQTKISSLTWNISGVVDAVQGGLIVIVEFLLFYFAIKYWKEGIISVGSFVLIQVYFVDLIGKLWDFGRIIRDFYEGFADAKEMVDILETPHEIRDLPAAVEFKVNKGEIEFQNVSFNYNETRNILREMNLKIKSGEKVAIIGPSGAGKSTFVRLLMRLYELTSGKILIDGADIKRVTQVSLRKNIAFVPQDPILFHRTLKENIRYGKPDATDEEVYKAAKLAHCDQFVEGLPDKYDTFVGERGIKLSGGERQRVAIARAILKNAPILILDEATSSLDSHSESLIQDALDHLMKGKTTIVIAHRLSTIRRMDRIIVLDNGKVSEEGTHDELVSRNEGTYKKLWELQAGGFIAS